MKTRETQWFIETDARSNEAVAKFLAGRCLEEENCQTQLIDIDGVFHSVWQVPDYKTVSLLLSARRQFGFKFKIFNRQNSRGIIREWIFSDKKKKKKSKGIVF